MVMMVIWWSATASVAAPVLSFFYEWGGEKIIKVMDLPNTETFKNEEGAYVDVGCIYKQISIVWIPLWNYDVRWCGYIGEGPNYLIMEEKNLSQLASQASLELPDGPSLPLWDSVGGKLLLVIAGVVYIAIRDGSNADS